MPNMGGFVLSNALGDYKIRRKTLHIYIYIIIF